MTKTFLICHRRRHCPKCLKPLDRLHCYAVGPQTCVSRLTELPAMHAHCARNLARQMPGGCGLVWKLRLKKPQDRSSRLMEIDGIALLHLYAPSAGLECYVDGQETRDYATLEANLNPAFTEAAARAESPEERQDLVHQIKWLHRYLHPRPKPPSPPVA